VRVAAFKKGRINRKRCNAAKRDGTQCGGSPWRDMACRSWPRHLPLWIGSLSGNSPLGVPGGLCSAGARHGLP